MAISIGSVNDYNLAKLNSDKEAASAVSSRVKGLNEKTDKDEAVKAIKEFESFFVEKILSKFEEEFIDGDDSNSKLTSFFMDQVNKEMAEKLIETSGKRLTQELYEQMARNYNINIKDASEDADTDSNVEEV